MKLPRLLLSAAIVSALAAALPASAHGRYGGHHARFGFYLGVPLAAPYFYPPAYYYAPGYYYPPPLAAVPAAPTYYMQQEPAPPAGYWYYCRDAQGYYPQIQQCPTPWQQVPAQPPK